MWTPALSIPRLSQDQLEGILEDALHILERIGLALPDNEKMEKTLCSQGFTVREKRLHIPRRVAREYLNMLQKTAHRNIAEVEFSGMISIYSPCVEVKPGVVQKFTAESLGLWSAFAQRCMEQYGLGWSTNVPGYACDVPAALESLHKYIVGARYCAQTPFEPSSRFAAPYLFEAAGILGRERDRIGVFPASPLSLQGDSVQVMLDLAEHLKSAYVYSMSMLGTTTPMSVCQGFAVNLAEVLGCAVALYYTTGVFTEIRPNLIPFDFRACDISFGSPEKFMLELMAEQVYAFVLEREPEYLSTNIHTHARQCGMQSLFEKGWMMAAGTMLGAKRFYCIGTLGMDRIFSPYQLVADLEMMQRLKSLAGDLGCKEPREDWIEELEEGLQEGFMTSEKTLNNYRMISAQGAFSQGTADVLGEVRQENAWERIQTITEELMRQPSVPLLAEREWAELEKLYNKAERTI